MADEDNHVHNTNHPSTLEFTPSRSGELQSSSQPHTFQSSKLGETPLNDIVRSLIYQFNSSGSHPPEELDQFE